MCSTPFGEVKEGLKQEGTKTYRLSTPWLLNVWAADYLLQDYLGCSFLKSVDSLHPKLKLCGQGLGAYVFNKISAPAPAILFCSLNEV